MSGSDKKELGRPRRLMLWVGGIVLLAGGAVVLAVFLPAETAPGSHSTAGGEALSAPAVSWLIDGVRTDQPVIRAGQRTRINGTVVGDGIKDNDPVFIEIAKVRPDGTEVVHGGGTSRFQAVEGGMGYDIELNAPRRSDEYVVRLRMMGDGRSGPRLLGALPLRVTE